MHLPKNRLAIAAVFNVSLCSLPWLGAAAYSGPAETNHTLAMRTEGMGYKLEDGKKKLREAALKQGKKVKAGNKSWNDEFLKSKLF